MSGLLIKMLKNQTRPAGAPFRICPLCNHFWEQLRFETFLSVIICLMCCSSFKITECRFSSHGNSYWLLKPLSVVFTLSVGAGGRVEKLYIIHFSMPKIPWVINNWCREILMAHLSQSKCCSLVLLPSIHVSVAATSLELKYTVHIRSPFYTSRIIRIENTVCLEDF